MEKRTSLFRYIITGGKSGVWWWLYLLILAAFWVAGIMERHYLVPIQVTVFTLAAIIYGSIRNRKGKQA